MTRRRHLGPGFWVRSLPGTAATARTKRVALVAVAAATAVLLAACIPYDLTGSLGADHVYVDNAGAWRVLGTNELIWSGPALSSGRVIPVAGNYDGEGRWEPATVDLATGTWTTAGARGTFVLPAPADLSTGAATVVPVPADYDGDGDTDPAYYDEDTATWVIEGRDPFVFGRPTSDPAAQWVDPSPLHDIAAPADYDGDGDADPAVYRSQNGDILVKGATQPIRTGMTYGLPAPANFNDGPGDEAAVLGLLGEGWAIEGEPPPAWPQLGRFPAPADYDGDGDGDADRGATRDLNGKPSEVWVDDVVVGPLPTGVRTTVAVPPSARMQMTSSVQLAMNCKRDAYHRCPGDDRHFVNTTRGVWENFAMAEPPSWISLPAGGLPLVADYDGDGTPEPAVYVTATGQWVTDGARGAFSYPAPADIDADPSTKVYPVPHDYDGDGDTDPAFYRDADATWFIEGQAPIQYGRTTATTPRFGTTPVHDIPVPGDYDGDGDTDLAVYRLESGVLSVRGQGTRDPGLPLGEPVVADEDGDGDDDLAIWDDADGTGTLHAPGMPPTSPFGFPPGTPVTGTPIAGDWDGDGDTEVGLLAQTTGGFDLRLRGFHPLTRLGSVSYNPAFAPAVGRNEVHANHAFVDAFIAACVIATPAPGDCQ